MSKKLTLSLLLFLISLAAAGIYRYLCNPYRTLPYYAHFVTGIEDHWTAYGGTWEVITGSMRNDSR